VSQIEQNTEDLNLILKMIKDMPAGEFYEGVYSFTPKINQQVVDTENRLLIKNFIIEKIPYAEVSNSKGGKTVSIG
jgi:hypothetical protein